MLKIHSCAKTLVVGMVLGLLNHTAFAVSKISQVSNAASCTKGLQVLDELKNIAPQDLVRKAKIEKAGQSLQVLCLQYNQYSQSQDGDTDNKEKLAKSIANFSDKLAGDISAFTSNAAELNLPYSSENFDDLTNLNLTLTNFRLELISGHIGPHDTTDDKVIETIIQSTGLAILEIKKLLAAAPAETN